MKGQRKEVNFLQKNISLFCPSRQFFFNVGITYLQKKNFVIKQGIGFSSNLLLIAQASRVLLPQRTMK